MSKIVTNKLHPAETNFISESESYLSELKDDTLTNFTGGGPITDGARAIADYYQGFVDVVKAVVSVL